MREIGVFSADLSSRAVCVQSHFDPIIYVYPFRVMVSSLSLESGADHEGKGSLKIGEGISFTQSIPFSRPP